MSTRYRVDVEVFQTFLANAFAVQESGLDRRSLSAVIEIQRFIAGDELDLDAAMQIIADHALRVSQASGVAIGLLEANKNELVYRAGSGSAESDVGRRVPAVLSASATEETRREILRVENAGSDTRIEAEICRQFGAMSLLILPIYRDRVLAGVMQVLFEIAHPFPESEVRAYRLMIRALEEGMSRSLSRARKPLPEANVQPLPEPVHIQEPAPSIENTLEPSPAFAQSAETRINPEPPTFGYEPVADSETKSWRDYEAIVVGEMTAFWSRFRAAMQSPAWGPGVRNSAAALGAVLILGTALWIVHRSGPTNQKVDLSGTTARDGQLQAPVQPSFGSETPQPLSGGSEAAISPSRGFKRVRVGPNEVDYIADDVTIRTFETPHPKPLVRADGKEVSFGDDVTVRYFAKSPALASESSGASESRPATKQSSMRSR